MGTQRQRGQRNRGFNGWTSQSNVLESAGSSGIWESFVPDVASGARYKCHIKFQYRSYEVDKADPFAFSAEIRPQTASLVWDLSTYSWGDSVWMLNRARRNGLDCAVSIYEVHLGSWRRVPEAGNRPLTYREMAVQLTEYGGVYLSGGVVVHILAALQGPAFMQSFKTKAALPISWRVSRFTLSSVKWGFTGAAAYGLTNSNGPEQPKCQCE